MSEDDLADVWARSLADLAGMQIEPHQRAWLQLTRPLGLVENTALIAAPNEFVKEQLETRLRGLITNALSRELSRNIQLAVTVHPAAAAAPRPPCPRAAPQIPGPPGPSPRPPRPSRASLPPALTPRTTTSPGPSHSGPAACRSPGSWPAATETAMATATAFRVSPDSR